MDGAEGLAGWAPGWRGAGEMARLQRHRQLSRGNEPKRVCGDVCIDRVITQVVQIEF